MSVSRKSVVLITGASGEIGHTLIERLADQPGRSLVTLDLNPLPAEFQAKVARHYVGSILDESLLGRILVEFEIDLIIHLAAVLSTRGEFAPLVAHQVNVQGTLNLLEFAQREGESHGRPVVFVYPSSVAVYGMPSLDAKNAASAVAEDLFNQPITMYGCNKLYGEHLGAYYARHYKQLSAERLPNRVDFRALRFPGLISAVTVPSGGTSDYAPEMIHAAAAGKAYGCFVRPGTRIPFMAMPDAVEAILRSAFAPAEALSRRVYNVSAFSPTAQQMEAIVREAFPECELTTDVDEARQRIVDSWPAELDDSAARRDWGHAPRFDLVTAFRDYLIPRIRERYR